MKTGGGNRVFFELSNCLVLKYKVIVVYPNNSLEGNNFSINGNIDIIKIGDYSTNKLKKIYNIIRIYSYINKNHRYDTIIISDPIICLFLDIIKNKKNVYRFIQADDYKIFDDKMLLKNSIIILLYKIICKHSYRQKINFIFNSKFVYEQFVHNSKRSDVNYAVVYPAINHTIFYDANQEDIRHKKLNIGLVGRKHPLKGLQIFIDMYQKLDDNIRDKIHNIYIISHDDLSSFDIKCFTVIKPKSDLEIADIYNKCSIFISTSWWEGFGLPGLEAMSCGCALITSDSGGCREYAVNNKNALIFTPKLVEDLISKFTSLLENKDLIYKLSESGKKTAQEFSWEKSALQIEKIISNV